MLTTHLMKNNLKMAFKYTELAEDAEEKRLPFLPSVDIPEKHDKDIDKNSSIYRFTVRFQC
jgi:hypothetical protein